MPITLNRMYAMHAMQPKSRPKRLHLPPYQQSNDIRPHRHRPRIVQSYSPCGANAHTPSRPNTWLSLAHTSLPGKWYLSPFKRFRRTQQSAQHVGMQTDRQMQRPLTQHAKSAKIRIIRDAILTCAQKLT